MNKTAYKSMTNLLFRGNLAFVPNVDPTKGLWFSNGLYIVLVLNFTFS
jgi:hypothetical protein